jgi:hypothetical protein
MSKNNRMKHILSFILPAIFAIMPYDVHAQSDTTETLEYEFQIEGNRRLFLRDANKITIWPQTKDSVVQMTRIQYTTLPTPTAITIEPRLIPAAKINVEEKLGYLYRGYIRAGWGSYNTTPVDFYFTDGRSKKGTYGLHYQLLRGDGVVLDDADSIPDRYSNNRAEAWGKWFFKKTQLLGKFNWERNVTHWYGVDLKNEYSGPSFDSLNFDQRMNTFGGGLSYLSYQRDTGEFNFNAEAGLRNTRDINNNSETHFNVLAHGRMLKDSTLFQADVGVNYNTFDFFGPQLNGKDQNYYNSVGLDTSFMSRNSENAIIKVVPSASTTWKGLRAKVGAGIYFDVRGEQKGHFYPLAEVSYSILRGTIVPFAGIKGNMEPTTYLSLYRQNPFIQSFPKLNNLNNKLDAYVGIGGAISQSLSYKAGFNYRRYGNFAYFINDSITSVNAGYYSWGNVFSVVYEDLTSYNIYGELALYAGEKWKANARADFFKYTTDSSTYAWHQPGMRIMANGQYNLKNKFIISTDIFYIGTRWAKSTVPVFVYEEINKVEQAGHTSYEYKLKGFLDANFRVEYRYNKRLSAWVQLNNAFGLKYQRWGNYPVQQLMATLGATYAF